LLSAGARLGKPRHGVIASPAAAAIVPAHAPGESLSMKNIALAALILLAATPALAGDPTGAWLTRNGESKVTMSKCGQALCGTIVALKNPNDANGKPKLDSNNPDAGKRAHPVVGTRIVLGMMPSSTRDRWNGQVYNPEDGRTYSGSITLKSASELDLQGCVAGGLICKTQTWTRTH
jgi:uncharacterized protein (DUF2147 family)